MLIKVIAISLLIILLPILILIALIIFIQTLESPIFVQERGLTLSKYRFRIYKFRTMPHTNLTQTFNNTFYRSIEKYGLFTFGRFLRKTGLDELPQLLNIIKGEMNMVGPRPLDLRDLTNLKDRFNKYNQVREKLDLLPGVTGYWQVYKNEKMSIQNLIELDDYYKENKSLKLDIKIICKSFLILLKAKHKDSIIISNNNFVKSDFLVECL